MPAIDRGPMRPSLFSTVIALALIAVVASVATSAHAKPLKLDWPDLLPKLPPMVDPLSVLDADQRIELETVLWVRQLTDQEREQRPEIVEEAERYERSLGQAGININKLIEDYAVWAAETEKRQKLVDPGLDGKQVAITGYLLPIEFSSDEGETDFLLVPYVGACIHVPAPPANQIVFVRLPKRMPVEELYTPVEVTGTMSTSLGTHALNLADGSADVAVGYSIAAQTFDIIRE